MSVVEKPQRFWMVFNSKAREPRKRHATLASATAEAQRVAAGRPGAKCYVLEAVGYAHQPEDGGSVRLEALQ